MPVPATALPDRRLGAFPDAAGTLFRVWALGRKSVEVLVEGAAPLVLEAEADGFFSAHAAGVGDGARYHLRIDGGEPIPDPASRFQPLGAGGPSRIVDPRRFAWTDRDWTGPGLENHVLYQLHVGTFTPEGTWDGARAKLEHLDALGITMLHVMPIGNFEAEFGWGYDVIEHYAPYKQYGPPETLVAFVDAAHALGIAVILDVVYNHVGPHHRFGTLSEHSFSKSFTSEWGESFDFDGPGAPGMREFVAGNAAYWIKDYHFDGLRIDATQALVDESDEHIIALMARRCREAAGARRIFLYAENQPQDHRLIDPPETGGYGLDALGNDDYHHTARVALTGRSDFYYRDYTGTPQEFVSSAKYGFLYHGQRSDMRDGAYGTDNLDTPPAHIVSFLENHDQIANSARGYRLAELGAPARVRALSAQFLLFPQTPSLFQGQEWGSRRIFSYFAGFTGEAADALAKGRLEQLAPFAGMGDPALQRAVPHPADPRTFEASRLDWRDAGGPMLALHRDLIALRRTTPAFDQTRARRIDGAVLSPAAFALRYRLEHRAEDVLILVNLGRDLQFGVVAEPLIAPPEGHRWVLMLSSDDAAYGGIGRPASDLQKFFTLPADTTFVLRAEPSKA